MYRISFSLALVASVCTMALSMDCYSSEQVYNCGGNDGNSFCHAVFQGCFHSTEPNLVLPKDSVVHETYNPLKWIQDGNAGDLITKCAKLAAEKHKNYVGIQNRKDCYFGDSLDQQLPRVTAEEGCNNFCRFDVGGQDAMVVYRVSTL